MAVVKNLMVRAGADFSAITKQANKASKSMRGMQSSVSRSCNMMTRAASGVKKALGAIGVGLGVAAIVNFGKEAASAYDTQIQGEMRLATVMRKTMGASNDEIQSIMELAAAEQQLGVVGDEAQLAGAQQLATYLHLSSSLQTLLPVMNDLAVQQYGFNVSEEQAASVAKLFGKAMEGQTGALTRYGFAVSAAQQQVLKYGTEAERAATLADIVSQKVGGMNAALAATPSGRMRQLSNALGDIKEQFGQAVRTAGTVFLPILNAVGSALAGIATIANKVAQALANVFGGSVAGKEWQWAGISAGVSDTADAMEDLTDAQNSSAGAAKKQKEALQTASFDTLNILRATDAASEGGSSGSTGIGSGNSPISMTQTSAEASGSSLEWLQQKLEKLKAVWEAFREKLDFTPMKNGCNELAAAIVNFASAVEQLLGPIWVKYLEPLAVWTINTALPAVLQGLAAVVDFLAERIRNLALLINGEMSFTEWLQTLPSVKNALNGIRTAITVVIAIGSALAAEWAVISAAAKKIGEQISEAWNTAVDNVKAAVANAKSNVTTVLNNLKARVAAIGQKILDGFTAPFESAFTTIGDIVEKIKGLLDFEWSIPLPKLPEISWSWNDLNIAGGFSIPIPKFSVSWNAKGGVFDRASLIGVGEDGKEAVVPLERNTGWISKVASDLAAQMTGGAGLLGGEALIEGIHDAVYEAMIAVMGTQSRSSTHETVFDINGREFMRAVWNDYRAVAREKGVSLVNT